MDARTRKIKRALMILFDQQVLLSHYAKIPIKTQNVKKAFRKKVKSVHPDKATFLGISEKELTSKFQVINEAYNLLLELLDHKEQIIVRIISKSSRGNYTRDFSALKRFYKGNLPGRQLRFAEFLFYSKVINFHTLIKAIVWQRNTRPLFGQLATELGYISPDDIPFIIRNKQRSELFGKTAFRLGLLSPYQLSILRQKQKKINCYIGEYFTNEKILNHYEIRKFLHKQRRHNFKFS